jgi:hypothetical protein
MKFVEYSYISRGFSAASHIHASTRFLLFTTRMIVPSSNKRPAEQDDPRQPSPVTCSGASSGFDVSFSVFIVFSWLWRGCQSSHVLWTGTVHPVGSAALFAGDVSCVSHGRRGIFFSPFFHLLIDALAHFTAEFLDCYWNQNRPHSSNEPSNAPPQRNRRTRRGTEPDECQ